MFNYSATIQQKRKKCGGRPRNGNKILRFYEKIQIRNDFKEILEDFRFFIFENSYFRRRGNPIIAIGKTCCLLQLCHKHTIKIVIYHTKNTNTDTNIDINSF